MGPSENPFQKQHTRRTIITALAGFALLPGCLLKSHEASDVQMPLDVMELRRIITTCIAGDEREGARRARAEWIVEDGSYGTPDFPEDARFNHLEADFPEGSPLRVFLNERSRLLDPDKVFLHNHEVPTNLVHNLYLGPFSNLNQESLVANLEPNSDADLHLIAVPQNQFNGTTPVARSAIAAGAMLGYIEPRLAMSDQGLPVFDWQEFGLLERCRDYTRRLEGDLHAHHRVFEYLDWYGEQGANERKEADDALGNIYMLGGRDGGKNEAYDLYRAKNWREARLHAAKFSAGQDEIRCILEAATDMSKSDIQLCLDELEDNLVAWVNQSYQPDGIRGVADSI